jgi:hypothetical protein
MHWIPTPQSLRGAMARRPYEYRGPSWSWVSMEAPIRHLGSYSLQCPFEAKLEAQILEVSCTPEGSDPRGRVKNGYMFIKAPACFAKVTHIDFCEPPKWGLAFSLKVLAQTSPDTIDRSLIDHNEPSLCTYATLEIEGQETRCFLDVPLVLARQDPAEVVIGGDVLCLQVSQMLGLVLRPMKTTSGSIVYRRVGILRTSKQLMRIIRVVMW